MASKDELETLDREWIDEKERHDSIPKLELLGFLGAISMLAGFSFVIFGLWLDDPPRPLFPWPGVCMVLGVCVVIGSLPFIMRIGRRHRAYNQAKLSYECRREKLLQELYADPQMATTREENYKPTA